MSLVIMSVLTFCQYDKFVRNYYNNTREFVTYFSGFGSLKE